MHMGKMKWLMYSVFIYDLLEAEGTNNIACSFTLDEKNLSLKEPSDSYTWGRSHSHAWMHWYPITEPKELLNTCN